MAYSNATVSREQVQQQLIAFLTKGQAHVTLEAAVDDLSAEMRSEVANGLPYSVWQLVEHLRFAQRDILNFCRNSDGKGGAYEAPAWPDDYWTPEPAPKNEMEWKTSLRQIEVDLEEFCELLQDESIDLTEPFAWGDGQNLLREALLIGDHNAYHVGEIVAVRRALGCWGK
jgi:hypothetical protein